MPRSRQIGFDGEQVGESSAFLIGELPAKTTRIENGLLLRRGHRTKFAEGLGDGAAAVVGKAAELMHGSAPLLSLGRSEALNCFVAFNQIAALFRRHIVELGQPVAQMLLGLGRKLAKAGLVAQSSLLLVEREIAVAAHPLLKMLLLSRSAASLVRHPLSRVGTGGRLIPSLIPHRPLCLPLLALRTVPAFRAATGGCRQRRHGCHKGQRQCRLEEASGFD